MNELTIKSEQLLDNNNIIIENLLNDFYKSIDVNDETIRTYKTGIKNFLQWVKDNEIKQIDKKVMISYKSYLTSKFKPTTATTYLSGVRVGVGLVKRPKNVGVGDRPPTKIYKLKNKKMRRIGNRYKSKLLITNYNIIKQKRE